MNEETEWFTKKQYAKEEIAAALRNYTKAAAELGDGDLDMIEDLNNLFIDSGLAFEVIST